MNVTSDAGKGLHWRNGTSDAGKGLHWRNGTSDAGKGLHSGSTHSPKSQDCFPSELIYDQSRINPSNLDFLTGSILKLPRINPEQS